MLLIAIIHFWWLIAKRPLRRYRTHVFPLTGMRIRVDGWRGTALRVDRPMPHA